MREISSDNPHAAFPLIRSWLEVVTIGLYLLRQPTYAQVLTYGPGDNRPGKKSFEAMFHAVREDAPGLKAVYRELSEYSHFGTRGIWNTFAIQDLEDRTVTWTDAPRWKSEKEFQIACAQANELAVAGLHTLDRLGTLLSPGSQ